MKAIIFDFSRVLLFPLDETYSRGLNELYKSVKERPDFNFLQYFKFNDELLEYLRSHIADGDFYILTSEVIQNDPVAQQKLKDIFTKIISAADFYDRASHSKEQPELYTEVLKTLNKRAEEVVFIDDNIKNVAAAKTAGLEAYQYISNTQALSLLEEKAAKY